MVFREKNIQKIQEKLPEGGGADFPYILNRGAYLMNKDLSCILGLDI